MRLSRGLQKKYAPKLAALSEKIRKAEQSIQREESQARDAKMQTIFNVGSTVLGAIFGNKKLSTTNVGRAASSARSASRAMRESQDVGRAEGTLETFKAQLDDLQHEFDSETEALKTKTDASTEGAGIGRDQAEKERHHHQAPGTSLGAAVIAPSTWISRTAMFLKGLIADSRELSSQIQSRSPKLNVIAGDLSLPLLILKDSALENNLTSMAVWSSEYGIELAPHGKTTMCPEIFARQLAHGAWGMTFAAVHQISAGLEAGFKRILIANQVAGMANLRALADAINGHSDVEFYSFVDSAKGAELLGLALRECGALRPLNVFLEWGLKGGRTGVRSVEAGREVDQQNSRPRWIPHTVWLFGI